MVCRSAVAQQIALFYFESPTHPPTVYFLLQNICMFYFMSRWESVVAVVVVVEFP